MTESNLSYLNFWIIAFNSTAAFVLAYLFIFYINQLSFLVTGGMYNYPVSIDYATYYFHIEPYKWTHDSVMLIFSAGYITTLFIGLLALLGFFYLLSDSTPIKVFFFWLILHASTYFFGGLMLGNLLTEGIGHVFNWMYLTDTVKMIISLIGFFGLLLTSLASSRLAALSANAYFVRINERNTPFFITAQVLLPYIIGSVLLIAYFLPKNQFHERYNWIIMGIMMLIFYSRSKYLQSLMFEEDSNRQIRPMKGFIVFSIIIYLFTRVFLYKPILFG
ncbi:MAG: hypothetical protein KKD74_01280 [Bacteroidetes bacterium]|nr:hypothetical protein [Bacteroidales bacterium]MBU1008740.1 hypothetical protein [Bacteroidota bacterium]